MKQILGWFRGLSIRQQVTVGATTGVVVVTLAFVLTTSYLPQSQLLLILPFFGLGVLLVAASSAWLHAQYIMGRLKRIEEATARIAAGDVDEPFIVSERDEIGQLAKSFEAMRCQLRAARDVRIWWERELEGRIRERTVEVQRLVERVIHAQEEERRRLSRELHDDTAQAMGGLLMAMEALRNSLPQDQWRVRQQIERVLQQGDRALEDLRRVILGLRPMDMDSIGVVAALRSYAIARLGHTGAHLDLVVQGNERRSPEAVEAALFRILQEAVNNAARHARAQNVRVRFDFQGDRLVATVEDDGRGFDPSQVPATGRGLGLEGMRERADIIGGRLEVTSALGKGTRVTVEFPGKRGTDG